PKPNPVTLFAEPLAIILRMMREPAVFYGTSVILRLVMSMVIIGVSHCPEFVVANSVQASTEARDHADRGMQLAQSGDLKAAEGELLLAIKLAPGDPAYLALMGGVLGMQQRLAESSAYFEKSLKIDPNDASTRRNLASNQFQMGQLQLAKENLD